MSQHWVSGGDTLILIPINNTHTVMNISSYVENLLEINIVLIPLFLIPINNAPTLRVRVPIFSIVHLLI